MREAAAARRATRSSARRAASSTWRSCPTTRRGGSPRRAGCPSRRSTAGTRGASGGCGSRARRWPPTSKAQLDDAMMSFRHGDWRVRGLKSSVKATEARVSEYAAAIKDLEKAEAALAEIPDAVLERLHGSVPSDHGGRGAAYSSSITGQVVLAAGGRDRSRASAARERGGHAGVAARAAAHGGGGAGPDRRAGRGAAGTGRRVGLGGTPTHDSGDVARVGPPSGILPPFMPQRETNRCRSRPVPDEPPVAGHQTRVRPCTRRA